MSKNYFISEHIHRNPTHGGITNKDIEITLTENGFIPIEFPHRTSYSFYSKCIRLLFLFRTFFTIPKNSNVFFQFPVYARLAIILVRLLRLRRNIRMICFVMDIDGLRDNDPKLLNKEIQFFKSFNLFIVHNESMKDWFLNQSVKGEYSILHIIGFLAKEKNILPELSYDIAYAGNLNKAPFLHNLSNQNSTIGNIHFHIYGAKPTFEIPTSKQITYHGVIEPAILPAIIKGAFGLIWEGYSTEMLEGSYATYTMINTPHKISLYIISGLPIICHEEMAIAKYIKQWRIGFTVKSISEISERIDKISEIEYKEMQKQCVLLTPKVKSGHFTMAAIHNLQIEA